MLFDQHDLNMLFGTQVPNAYSGGSDAHFGGFYQSGFNNATPMENLFATDRFCPIQGPVPDWMMPPRITEIPTPTPTAPTSEPEDWLETMLFPTPTPSLAQSRDHVYDTLLAAIKAAFYMFSFSMLSHFCLAFFATGVVLDACAIYTGIFGTLTWLVVYMATLYPPVTSVSFAFHWDHRNMIKEAAKFVGMHITGVYEGEHFHEWKPKLDWMRYGKTNTAFKLPGTLADKWRYHVGWQAWEALDGNLVWQDTHYLMYWIFSGVIPFTIFCILSDYDSTAPAEESLYNTTKLPFFIMVAIAWDAVFKHMWAHCMEHLSLKYLCSDETEIIKGACESAGISPASLTRDHKAHVKSILKDACEACRKKSWKSKKEAAIRGVWKWFLVLALWANFAIFLPRFGENSTLAPSPLMYVNKSEPEVNLPFESPIVVDTYIEAVKTSEPELELPLEYPIVVDPIDPIVVDTYVKTFKKSEPEMKKQADIGFVDSFLKSMVERHPPTSDYYNVVCKVHLLFSRPVPQVNPLRRMYYRFQKAMMPKPTVEGFPFHVHAEALLDGMIKIGTNFGLVVPAPTAPSIFSQATDFVSNLM